MAAKTGIAVGPAIATLEMVKLLKDLPALAAAFRDGRLSEVQAREIAEVASQVPDAEEELVAAAGKLTLRGLREECERVEAAALLEEDERHRRVHRQRRTRAWVRKGVGCNDKQLFYVQPSTMTDYGVGYHRPDTVDHDPRHCGDKSDHREYNWDSGEIHTNFALGRRCETQRLFVASKFGHTWEKTNITGFGISIDGISIQWENEGRNFEAFPNEQGYYDCHF